jgi:hypothetical protein
MHVVQTLVEEQVEQLGKVELQGWQVCIADRVYVETHCVHSGVPVPES